MIGSNLTSKLLIKYPKKENNEIIGIDNLSRGKLSNLKDSCGELFNELSFIKSDLISYNEEWVNEFQNCDIVIHLADVVGGIGYVFKNESYIFRTNLLINSNVSRAISQYEPKRYIYVGTACSFPRDLQLSTNSKPLIEEDQFPAFPESGYGWSKLMGEIECGYLIKERLTNGVILSLHNVYGKYCDFSSSSSQVIPSLCIKALKCKKNNHNIIELWGNGTQGRAFVHVNDVVNAIILSFNKGENEGVIQIGPNKCTTINELAYLILNKVDRNINISHNLTKPIGDIGRCANYRKANQLLGWEPLVSLEEGIIELIDWLKTQI